VVLEISSGDLCVATGRAAAALFLLSAPDLDGELVGGQMGGVTEVA